MDIAGRCTWKVYSGLKCRCIKVSGVGVLALCGYWWEVQLDIQIAHELQNAQFVHCLWCIDGDDSGWLSIFFDEGIQKRLDVCFGSTH